MSFSHYETVASVSRLGAYSGDKSTYASVGDVEGNFEPVSPSMEAIAEGAVSQSYQFVCDIESDVRDNDRLTIESEVYGVKGTSKFRLGSVEFLRCILEKAVND